MSFHRLAAAVGLAALAVAASGCSQSADTSHVVMPLPSDGYLAFAVHHPNASGRPGVLVELRNAPPGAYVLVFSPEPPRDVGWFALDPAAYAGCTARERKATGEASLDCVLPHGRGEVADIVVVDGPALLPARDGTTTKPAPTTLLRHATTPRGRASSSTSSDASSTYAPPWTGYYGLLRVTPGSEPVEVGLEGLSLEDEADAPAMSIERL